MGRAMGVGLAVLVLCIASLAAAEDKAAARQAYVEGSKHYDLNQFADALEAFKRAYWHYEDPVILYNIAQCHRALKHKTEAIDFYRSYLRKAPGAANRDEVQRIIADLDSAIAREKTLSMAPLQGKIATEPKPTPSSSVSLTPKAEPSRQPVVAAIVTTRGLAKPGKPAWKRAWVWGVVAGVVVVGVAVGVGVGVGAQPQAPTAADGSVTF